jgi:myo-inositol 2-dehydrogenase/D-chiro-inositol 1-dehydrogenase
MPYGIFYDTMIHDFDMVRWMLDDEIVEVFARTACMLDASDNPHRDPDTAMVQLRMQGGALVHVNSSFRAVYGYDQRIEAFGEKGMLISRNQQPTSLERHSADGIRQDSLLRFFIERYAESYRRELDDSSRDRRRERALDRHRDGARALVSPMRRWNRRRRASRSRFASAVRSRASAPLAHQQPDQQHRQPAITTISTDAYAAA